MLHLVITALLWFYDKISLNNEICSIYLPKSYTLRSLIRFSYDENVNKIKLKSYEIYLSFKEIVILMMKVKHLTIKLSLLD